MPIFEKLLKEGDSLDADQIKALIISPTRELAYQIYQVAAKLQKALGKVGVKCLFGKITEAESSKDKEGKKTNEIESNGQNILVANNSNLDHHSRKTC